MKDCFRRLLPASLALLLFTGAFISSCTDIDDRLGMGLLPDDQEMTFSRAVLDGIRSYSAMPDSIPLNYKNMMALGNYATDGFGHLRSGAAIQFVFAGTDSDEEDFFGYMPVIDSLMLTLYISGVYGDTTKQQKFYIYELDKKIPVWKSELDGYEGDNGRISYYPGFDAGDYADMSTPLFSFTLGNDIGTVIKKLEYKTGAEAFIKKLTDVDTDIYLDTHADSLFHNLFNGLYITPSEDPAEAPLDAGLYIVSPLSALDTYYYVPYDNSYLELYWHNYYEDPTSEEMTDPEIIDGEIYYKKDNLYSLYSFDDTYISYPNTNIIVLDRDYSGALFDTLDFVKPADFTSGTIASQNPIYVQGLAGVAGYLDFGDEFLRQLHQLAIVDGEQLILNVNRARMFIWLEDDGVPYLNLAPSRLGMYYNYRGTYPTSIPDFDYINEINYASSSYVSAFGGYLNRSMGYYEMDITNYVTRLANNPEETRQQAWLGLPAHSTQMFEPVQVVLQNPPDDASGTPAHKRIMVQLTYTLLKDAIEE